MFVMWVDVLLVLVAPVLSSCLVVPATYICMYVLTVMIYCSRSNNHRWFYTWCKWHKCECTRSSRYVGLGKRGTVGFEPPIFGMDFTSIVFQQRQQNYGRKQHCKRYHCWQKQLLCGSKHLSIGVLPTWLFRSNRVGSH